MFLLLIVYTHTQIYIIFPKCTEIFCADNNDCYIILARCYFCKCRLGQFKSRYILFIVSALLYRLLPRFTISPTLADAVILCLLVWFFFRFFLLYYVGKYYWIARRAVIVRRRFMNIFKNRTQNNCFAEQIGKIRLI